MIIQLTGETKENVQLHGGKGCGLVRLQRAGFEVPDVWCLPADVYSSNGGGLSKEMKDHLKGFWEEFRASHPDQLMAVRSSGTAEDMEGASFAGLYVTTLGVDSAEKLVKAVEDCYASLHSEAVRSYRDTQGIGHDVSIAVLMQRMVPSDVSGVMLTANPSRAFAQEVVIDAAYGLGEAIVSGRTHPDHIVLDRNTLEVRQEMLGEKEVSAAYVTGKGIQDSKVDNNRRKVRCLSDGQIAKLGEMSSRVGSRIGPRQDCEWAFEGDRLFMLQQRPITGLPPENPKEIYSRKFADEFLTEYVVPFAKIFVDWINGPNFNEVAELIGRGDLHKDPVQIHNGYAYFSGVWASEYLKAYPKFFRAPGRVIPDWFTPLWFRGAIAERFHLKHFLNVLAGPNKDKLRGPADKTLEALENHTRKIDAELVPKLTQDYTKLTDEQWWAWYEELNAFGLEHFRTLRWGMSTHMIVFHGVLQFLLQRWAKDDDRELFINIVSGLPDTRTAQVNRDIFNLSMIARGEESLRKKILDKMSYADLRKEKGYDAFWTAFDTFIKNHGHRGPSRSPVDARWQEDPDTVLGLVRAQQHGEQTPKNPVDMERESGHRREEAEKEALARAGKGLFGGIRKKVLANIIKRAQQFTLFRENQRYHLDYLLFQKRLLGLEMGRRMTKQGLLSEPFDAMFIYEEELYEMRDKPMDKKVLKELIRTRREHYERWRNRVPATYLFDGVETEGDAIEGDPSPDALSGEGGYLGVSRGIYKGTVRLVLEMSHLDDLEPGDILVTENIDPAWTNVFPILGGLITETGGILAHGALLAREYSIPAVMNVPGATQTYKTGDRIEIDGTKGTIEVLS